MKNPVYTEIQRTNRSRGNNEPRIVIQIRDYTDSDSIVVGKLIADTYSAYNLNFADSDQMISLLGPFAHAYSMDKEHQDAIAQTIRSEKVYLALIDGEIVGVLRGRIGRLASLFVRGDHHRSGIGSRLVGHFEHSSAALGGITIKVASTLYAVPFYLKMGYKKSTGVRPAWSFGGVGLVYQPMRKFVDNE